MKRKPTFVTTAIAENLADVIFIMDGCTNVMAKIIHAKITCHIS